MTEYPGQPMFESAVLLTLILAILLFSILENLLPRLQPRAALNSRWPANIVLFILTFAVAYIMLPVTAWLLASWYGQFGFTGLIPADWPLSARVFSAVLMIDLGGYWLHRFSHFFIPLWRLHRVHHSDGDMDFTTGYRHHPLEVVIGVLFRVLMIVMLAPHWLGLAVHDMLRAFVDIFSHANIRIHPAAERVIRLIFITPDMHRVHHSDWQPQTDSNYGSLFSFWDRLFRSYRNVPLEEQQAMGLGQGMRQSDPLLRAMGVLRQPFISRRELDQEGFRIERSDSK